VADDNLQIRVTADISNLQAQMAAAAATVADTGAEMTAATAGASLSFRQLGDAGEEAGERTAAGMREARGGAKLLAEETGLHLNREMKNVIASSEVLGKVMQAAFPIAAAVGGYEIVSQVATKISGLISDTLVYTQAMKDEYAAQLSLNKGIAEQVAKLDALKQAYDLIGLSGAARVQMQFQQLTVEVEKNEAALKSAQTTMFLYQRGAGEGSNPLISAAQYAQAQKDVAALTAVVATGQQQQANLEKEYDIAKAAEDKAAADTAIAEQQRVAQAAEQLADKTAATQRRVYEIIAKAHEDLDKAIEKDDDQTAKFQIMHAENVAKEQERVTAQEAKDEEEKTRAAEKTIDEITKYEERQLTEQQKQYQKFFESITNGFRTAINGWLQGTQSFSKAVQKLWQSLAMGIVDQILKMGEQWLITHVLMAAANALFHTQTAAQDTAAAAQHVAQTSATNYMEAVGYANVAAAQTLADVPFPANIPASASTLALGMSYAGMSAFALGGVVPRTQVALVHGGERVLTPSQNMAFERMARGGFASNITQHIHGVSNPVRAAHLASTMAVGRVRRLASDWGYR
jgi:hypothetical protein